MKHTAVSALSSSVWYVNPLESLCHRLPLLSSEIDLSRIFSTIKIETAPLFIVLHKKCLQEYEIYFLLKKSKIFGNIKIFFSTNNNYIKYQHFF